jgi:hypothetical protein
MNIPPVSSRTAITLLMRQFYAGYREPRSADAEPRSRCAEPRSVYAEVRSWTVRHRSPGIENIWNGHICCYLGTESVPIHLSAINIAGFRVQTGVPRTRMTGGSRYDLWGSRYGAM